MASTCLSWLVLPSSFVIGSAIMSSVAQCSSVSLSVVMASRTKWYRMSMCFVRLCSTGFLEKSMHPLLSTLMLIGPPDIAVRSP